MAGLGLLKGFGNGSTRGGPVAADRTTTGIALLESGSDYALAAVLGLAATATVGTWATGQVAGLLFHRVWLPVSLGQGLGIATALPHHLDDPRQAWPAPTRADLPGPAGFVIAAILVVVLLAVTGIALARRLGRGRQVRGFASPAHLRASLSARSAIGNANRLRPGLNRKNVTVEDVGVDLGRSNGVAVVGSVDSSVLVVAAPRQGKTSQIIIPWLRSWPGPALVTSVRTDVVLATLTLRQDRRPVAVMDLSGTRWPHPLRWSPIDGCGEFDIARQRADVMVSVGKSDGPADSTNAGFFGLTATNLLAGWLHTAAVTGRSMSDVLTWALDERDDEPIRLLRNNPRAAPGVAGMLDNIYRSPVETRSNMWTTVMTGVAPLLSQTARDVFSPPPGTGFDITAFLRSKGTVYLLVPEHQATDLAPLISAFVDELTHTAARLAAATVTGRLDPPLGMFLDEVANVVPLPRLPSLMSYAGGTGIFVVAVLQDIAQARQRWGRDGADMLWGAATLKIALGGLSGDELGEFSRLCGQYRETLTTTQRGSHGTTLQTNLTDRPVISADEIRTLSAERREALIVHATTPPVLTRMIRHYESRHARHYAEAVTQAQALLAAANGHILAGAPSASGEAA